MTPNELIKAMEWRYAVKKFDSQKKISEAQWTALERALALTPSSYGLQPWKFLVVQNPEIRKQLTAHSWRQTQVEDCSHFVVFASLIKLDERYIDGYLQSVASARSVAVDTMAGYRKMMEGDLLKGPRSQVIPDWAARQAYIALGNLMTVAAMLEVDACPMEGIDPAKYDEILGLRNSDYRTVVACAVGYRSAEDKYSQVKKVRFPNEQLFQRI